MVVDQAEFVLQPGKRLQVGLEAPEREQGGGVVGEGGDDAG